jgi:hypothetical protein
MILAGFSGGLDLGQYQAHHCAKASSDGMESQAEKTPAPASRLREQVHEVMRFFHYSARTEQPTENVGQRTVDEGRVNRQRAGGPRLSPIAADEVRSL